MDPCCYADEYGEEFGRRYADRKARQFRRRGLTGTARTLADAVTDRGVEGATILEVGGGAGSLQVHLLRRGASHATNVDLSPEWDGPANALLAEHGLQDRVTRRVGDFVVAADELDPADVVVLHRVVCCYPHWQQLLAQAAGRATRMVALTFPRRRRVTGLAMALGNAVERLRRREFRVFVHPPKAMLGLLREAGFEVVFDEAGFFWRTVVVEQAAS